MNENDVERIAAWLVERGLAGASETELLHGLCKRCCQGGLPLSRTMALVDTLHPVYEGRVFRWRNDGVEESAVLEYGPSNVGEDHHLAEQYLLPPLDVGHERASPSDRAGGPIDFPLLATLKQEGHTDYVALIHRFAGEGVIGEMDCVYSSWATSHPDGFSDADRSRCGGSCRRSRWRSNAPRWRASPETWSRSI